MLVGEQRLDQKKSIIESVWDYPRPPLVEETQRHLQVFFNGLQIAETRRAWRVLETSHPPVYYFPQADVRMEFLLPERGTTFCEWKGTAVYYTVQVGKQAARRAAWSYPNPTPSFMVIKNAIAFYPALMEACLVDGEAARPQPGGFYGGWITDDITGPFKGEPGSAGW